MVEKLGRKMDKVKTKIGRKKLEEMSNYFFIRNIFG
jgi:hypothetical protein